MVTDETEVPPVAGSSTGPGTITFESLMEQDEEEDDVIFEYGDGDQTGFRMERNRDKQERKENPWVLDIDPKPKPFYDNHLEPWAGLNEEQINSTLYTTPHFIFAAVAGRRGNDGKKGLITEATKWILNRQDVRTISLRKESPWVVVALESTEEIEKLKSQGAVINRYHNTIVIFRAMRRTAHSERCLNVLRVVPAIESEIQTALMTMYPNTQIAVRRRQPVKEAPQTDVLAIIRLPKGAKFTYPTQLKIKIGNEATGSWEVKRAPGCSICLSADHFDNECLWHQVRKDFDRIRVDHGEERRPRRDGPVAEKVD